jgi:2-polyprenyl-3-methyl-5-hydroxy-6-metoxy-1,4-benzoquinol methylase
MNKKYFFERDSCPICKNNKFLTIYSCDFLKDPIKTYIESFYNPIGNIDFDLLINSTFVICECNNCNFFFQKQIPNEFLNKKIYTEWIDPGKHFSRHLTIYNDKNYYSKIAQEIMVLIDYFNVMPNKINVFDYGMGWGHWCQMAQAFGCNTFGYEVSELQIKNAKTKGISVISWDDIPKYSFDFINTEQVFEHIDDPLETLCYLKKSLKQNGLIKISVPDGNGIKKKIKLLNRGKISHLHDSIEPILPFQHINCFTRESIIKMATLAGFKLKKIPLSILYANSTNWKLIKPIIINCIKPLYTNVLSMGTSLYFEKI